MSYPFCPAAGFDSKTFLFGFPILSAVGALWVHGAPVSNANSEPARRDADAPPSILSALAGAKEPRHSYVDLIGTLTNLQRLAELPFPGETSGQWTSRDRTSTFNSATGQYVNWGANDDFAGNLGVQSDGGIVLAEMNGPGCIWRIWSAQTGPGHVKIFLEDSTHPVVDMPFRDFFNSSRFPFNFRSLNYVASGGFNSYLPIPYQTSCKVVAYGDWGRYFHVGYSAFQPGTTVPTFTPNLTDVERDALADVDQFLMNCLGEDPAGRRQGEVTITNAFTLPPGQTVTVLNLKGARAITAFKVRVKNPSEGRPENTLRELTVSMFWDSRTEPAVWAPLGDFFGSAFGYRPYKALPLGLREDGWMYSYWYSPFESGARIQLANDGTLPRELEVIITHAPLTWPPGALGRFHAKWLRGEYVTENGRSPDYRFLSTRGRGRFVGLAQHVFQKKDVSPGPWWGEGDEKFFVDEESMPSWFGTGSEDYYGFAWGTPGYFSRPYHSQLLSPPGNLFAPGNRALNRFHISDSIPFQVSFEGCLEKWEFTDESNTRYGMMPYWYLSANSTDPSAPPPLDVRTNYYDSNPH